MRATRALSPPAGEQPDESHIDTSAICSPTATWPRGPSDHVENPCLPSLSMELDEMDVEVDEEDVFQHGGRLD